MSASLRPVFFAAAALGVFALVACQKNSEPAGASPKAEKVAVEFVPEAERSKHFAAVNRQLELGGTLYGYADVDGDLLKLMGSLKAILGEASKVQPQVAPFAEKDLAAIATTLGLTDVKAIGASSVADAHGFYRNRLFFYTGGERHGLLAGLGGKAGPFTHLNLAPADTVFYAETELDLPVVYSSIKDAIGKLAGQPAQGQFETAIQKSGEQVALSVLDLIYGLKGHSSLLLRLDGQKPTRLPGAMPVTIPGYAWLISIDGVAPVIEPSLAKAPLKRSEQGTYHVYEFPASPASDQKTVLVVDGKTLHLATSFAFFRECREQATGGMAQDAAFKSALAAVGPEGNGLVYVSPKFAEELRKIETLNPNLPPEMKGVLTFILDKLPQGTQPLVAIRANLPDGILVRSYWDHSLKQELAMASVYNPVTVGLLAAMAIPAFQKVRSSSQEKAVLNNLRMLDAAADQYYLENGVRTATYDQLVGPERYVKAVNSVAGEDYRTLRFVQGQSLRVKLQDGRVIEYPPGVVTPAPGAKKR